MILQQHPQKLRVGKSRVRIGRVQQSVHVVRVVFDFLGEKLGCAEKIPAHFPDQQSPEGAALVERINKAVQK